MKGLYLAAGGLARCLLGAGHDHTFFFVLFFGQVRIGARGIKNTGLRNRTFLYRCKVVVPDSVLQFVSEGVARFQPDSRYSRYGFLVSCGRFRLRAKLTIQN